MITKQTVLITGASGGIGYEMAKLFAQDGSDLILIARDKQKLLQSCEQLRTQFSGTGGAKINIKAIAVDLSLPTAPQEIVTELNRESLNIDVLVNNAGYGLFGNFWETDQDKEIAMIHLNVISLTLLTKLLLPQMLARKSGKILNVASTAAFLPGPLMAVYYATKAYVLSFSEALAEELVGTGVTVTTLCPGPTKSGFQKLAQMEKSKLIRGKMSDTYKVAQAGYKALAAGKRIEVVGIENKFLVHMLRILPRTLTAKIVKNAQAMDKSANA